MDTSHIEPFVIWCARTTKNFVLRIVDRGPARPDKNEAQFIIERGAGRDGMFEKRWLPVNREIWHDSAGAVIAVLARTLGSYPEDLVAGHLIGCDVNLSRIEKREVRGCDCLGAPGRYGRRDPTT